MPEEPQESVRLITHPPRASEQRLSWRSTYPHTAPTAQGCGWARSRSRTSLCRRQEVHTRVGQSVAALGPYAYYRLSPQCQSRTREGGSMDGSLYERIGGANAIAMVVD